MLSPIDFFEVAAAAAYKVTGVASEQQLKEELEEQQQKVYTKKQLQESVPNFMGCDNIHVFNGTGGGRRVIRKPVSFS